LPQTSLQAEQNKAAIILAAIAASEGFWLFWNFHINGGRFMRYAGFYSLRSPGILGWFLALFVAASFMVVSSRLASVRANLFRPSLLKLLAVSVAVASGFCEEVIFRKLLMDSMQHHGWGVSVQLVASALSFGLAHAVWGLMRGSLGAAVRATLFTGGLGLALALVYIASHRIVSPCVVSHLLINLLVEPGLVLAAVRGEMR
jgi:membrane protease YdiL (CAAX protease family)